MFNHILTSVIGSHPKIQDAIKYYEDDYRIIAVVADGLGSRPRSAEGARRICKFVIDELKSVTLPLKTTDLYSPQKWNDYYDSKKLSSDDYCTTCSFAVIEKKEKMICIGQIGDSPIFVRIDEAPVVEMRQEKDFSNITDCLGGKTIKSFLVKNYTYNSSLKVLVTSDGIGDELESSTLESMLAYLSETYQGFSPKYRSRRFTKEIKATIGNVNNDDKSAIFIWST